MLDTVDDLRYRMAGLPNAQTIEQLASDLHAKTERITHDLDTTTGKLAHDLRLKADRAEIDRLQRWKYPLARQWHQAANIVLVGTAVFWNRAAQRMPLRHT
jgi:hypothetical protein